MNLRRSRPARWLAAPAVMIIVASGAALASVTPAAAWDVNPDGPDVVPTEVDGNPSCESLGFAYGVKVDPPNPGTYTVGNGSVTWTTPDGKHVNWTSTIGIDAVIVKGGNAGNAYVYAPPSESFGDNGLVSPLNDGGQVPDISHVDFCFDYDLEVSKTAKTTFDRTYKWDVEKTSNVTNLVLSPGQQHSVDYTVTATNTGSTDSNWAVSGKITIKNPDPNNVAKVASVTDVITPGDLAATVDCGADSFTIAAGATKECTYSRALPTGENRTNTATVTVANDSKVDGGSGTAPVTFGDPTNEVNECVEVFDDKAPGNGVLGQVCVDESPKEFKYSLTVGPYEECGMFDFENTAIVRKGSTVLDSDTWTIKVNVPCDAGCTLTQGYWKTHSAKGPAPYDNNWLNIGDVDGDGHIEGQDETFFKSGKTWYEVFWTPPAGNPYYNLAHQYMAAKLNVVNGASTTPAVATALTSAESLFNTYTPAQVNGGSKALKKQFTDLASTLDKYNNGLIGPGHCSESSERAYTRA